jgi:hypothetical protein
VLDPDPRSHYEKMSKYLIAGIIFVGALAIIQIDVPPSPEFQDHSLYSPYDDSPSKEHCHQH